jgi:hypothetical protein
MSWEDLRSGSVIRYSYLWVRQYKAGETEGRKARPSAVGFRITREGGDLLLLFPITTSPPAGGRWTVEVPEMEKHRAGLDADIRQWILLDEANVDVIGNSYYMQPEATLGEFSRAFFGPLMQQVIKRMGEIEKVPRR